MSKCQSRNSLLRTALAGWPGVRYLCAILSQSPLRRCPSMQASHSNGDKGRSCVRPTITWARRHSATGIHIHSHSTHTRGGGKGRTHQVRGLCGIAPLSASNTANLDQCVYKPPSCRGVTVSGVGNHSPPRSQCLPLMPAFGWGRTDDWLHRAHPKAPACFNWTGFAGGQTLVIPRPFYVIRLLLSRMG